MDIKKDIGKKVQVFLSNKYLHFALVWWEKNNNNNDDDKKMNKMAQNDRFHLFKKIPLSVSFDFILTSWPKQLPIILLRLLLAVRASKGIV